MAHSLPPLPYAAEALEPFIDRQTMELHHDKHHRAYVSHLNAAIEPYRELHDKSADDLLRGIQSVPHEIRSAVRNNAGGHVNHSMFWRVMGPNAGGLPTGEVAEAINASFGSFEAFRDRFSSVAVDQFGSGWAWVIDHGDRLTIESTANQDSPLMEGRTPLFGLDLWEHAYYLKYQNRRADYIEAWWNVVNWAAINERLVREPASNDAARHEAIGAR